MSNVRKLQIGDVVEIGDWTAYILQKSRNLYGEDVSQILYQNKYGLQIVDVSDSALTFIEHKPELLENLLNTLKYVDHKKGEEWEQWEQRMI